MNQKGYKKKMNYLNCKLTDTFHECYFLTLLITIIHKIIFDNSNLKLELTLNIFKGKMTINAWFIIS